jgi:hypothetical protein
MMLLHAFSASWGSELESDKFDGFYCAIQDDMLQTLTS